ncbi:MAG TPA: hypothetical protein VGD43_03190, partial [Micromonospora sp.]
MADDTLYARLKSVSGNGVGAWVNGPDGARLCYLGPYLNECQLGAAGTYTVTVELSHNSGTGAYTLSAESRRTPSECDTLPENFFSWASEGRSGTLPTGLAVRCFKFDQPTGTVLHVDRRGTGDVRGVVHDAQHQPAGCSVDYGNECTLTGPGPYRLFL